MEKITLKKKQQDGTEKEVTVFVKKPSPKDIRKADIYQSKIWTECIKEGVPTKEQLIKTMQSSGIIDEELIEKKRNIESELEKLEKKLYLGDGKKTEDIEEGKKTALMMKLLRDELVSLSIRVNDVSSNSADSIAENARFDYLVSACVCDENGNRVYNNIEEYESKSSDEIAYAAAEKLAEMLYGISSQNENSPEDNWFKQLNLVDEEGNFIDESSNRVDFSGRKLNENGFYVNDKGERTDSEGNLVDENGNYVIQVKYQKRRKKATARKKTSK